jgi:large subunit ribosomal protein L3
MGGILGKKIRMTQIFDESGRVVPVTVISAGPCYVTQIKTVDKDGYDALQVAYDELTKEKHHKKPIVGHFGKANLKPHRHLREFKPDPGSDVKVGDEIKVDIFNEGEQVKISGRSKGRGFQGTMRRHGFSGANKTHGQSDRWRAPGSLGQSSYPSRVFKGLGMAGRMGNKVETRSSSIIIRIDAEKNLLFVKGSVPGGPQSLVEIMRISS